MYMYIYVHVKSTFYVIIFVLTGNNNLIFTTNKKQKKKYNKNCIHIKNLTNMMKYAYTHDFLIFKKEIQKKVFLVYVFINIQSDVIQRIIIHVVFERYRLIPICSPSLS